LQLLGWLSVEKSFLVQGAELLQLPLAEVMSLLVQSVVKSLALLLAEDEVLLLPALAMALVLAMALDLLVAAACLVAGGCCPRGGSAGGYDFGWPYHWWRGAATGSCLRFRVLVCVVLGKI